MKPSTKKARYALPSGIEPLWTIHQLMAYFQISRRTAEDWISTGYAPKVYVGIHTRKNVRFDQSEIMKWQASLSTKGRATRMPTSAEAVQ